MSGLTPGNLYQSCDKIWDSKSWLVNDSYFIFVNKIKSNKTWQIYKFIYKNRLLEFEIHNSSNIDNIFRPVKSL